MSFNLVNTAYAATAGSAPAHSQPGLIGMLPYFILIIAVVYFFMIRPQSKRAKEQKSLLEALRIGDEVVSVGGIVGTVSKLRDDFIVVTISDGVTITLQRQAISAQLPKGTFSKAD
jgi:preprotein translocase subunit YajC